MANVDSLDRLGQRRILKRNDPLYITRLFKSRWQPLPAYIGIVGCFFVVVWSGIPPLVILIARGSLTSSENLKSTSALAFDVIGAYIGVSLLCLFKYCELTSAANRFYDTIFDIQIRHPAILSS